MIELEIILEDLLDLMEDMELQDPGVILFAPFTDETGHRGGLLLHSGEVKEEDFLAFGKGVSQVIKTL